MNHPPPNALARLCRRIAPAALLLLGLAQPAWAALTVNADGTVLDTTTSLVWDQCPYGLTGATCATGTALQGTWAQALDAAVAANAASYKGFSDWRVPNKNELDSIAKIDTYSAGQPAIDTTAFPGTPLANFWTSTTYAPFPSIAWIVNFDEGWTVAVDKSLIRYVRLVRSGQSFAAFDSMQDTIPDAFAFTAQTGVALSAVATSNTITVAGINAPSAIIILGGTYSINGGAYTAAAGNVNNGDTVTVRQTALGIHSMTTRVILSIGGVIGNFDVTTLALVADTTPDAFAFTAQTGAALNAVTTSNTVTVAGINAPSAISIAGGTYSVNGGAYTATAGTVNNGDTVTVRQTASGANSTTTTATLTIGGVSGAFSVTTVALGAPPSDPIPIPTPSIVALNMPLGCGLRAWPGVADMVHGEGPAFTADLVAMLSKALGQALVFVEQGVCGTVTLSGYRGGKLAFVPHSYQGSGDPRANGVYDLGDGRYQVVRNGQSLIIAPAVVHLDQLTALFPGLSATQGDNGVIIASINGLTYAVRPGVAVQQDPATGSARLIMGADGYWHFIDALGNNQILYPAFADVASLRNALQSQDPLVTLSMQLDGTASIVFKGKHFTLVPDITLGKVPAERVGQYWWQESALRFWVTNAQPLGTAQGFIVKP